MAAMGRLAIMIGLDGSVLLDESRLHPCFQEVGGGIWGLSDFHRVSWGPVHFYDPHNHRGLQIVTSRCSLW